MDKWIMLFKLNDKIELRSKDNDKTPGLIYDIKDEKIYISISADDQDFKLLEIGEKIKGVIYCKKEVLGLEATVSGREFTNTSVYELSNIGNFKKIQRRENIRVTNTKSILYTDNDFIVKLDFNERETKEDFKKIEKYLKEGLILDLSAGGVKLSTKESFNIGKRLVLVINFDKQNIILKGKVVHKEINLIPKKTVYLYGVKFIDIKEGQQEKIIRHLFVMMRKNRIN
ncbi:flagellar brake protein [Tissierella creatinophila]|nr:PilZ domain-containing protein [Tissierella creatinophila]